MKCQKQFLKCFLIGLGLLFVANNLLSQTNQPPRKFLSGFDRSSQNNIEVIAAGNGDFAPCPSEYTNIISNTNLFTADEQKLLREIPLIYGKVTTNSGPLGSVLIDYHAKPIESQYGTFWYWTARFQFTNSDMWDEVTPGGDQRNHKIRNKNGDGYDIGYDTYNNGESVGSGYGGPGGANFWLHQIKHGVYDGLYVEIDHGEHCVQLMRYSNGMAVGQWLYWSPYDNKLMIWAKFKKPYDISKYRIKG